MRLVKKKAYYAIGQCEKCNKKYKLVAEHFSDSRGQSMTLKDVIKCGCGKHHNLVAPDQTQPTPTPKTFDHTQTDNTIRCGRCNSTQLHADKKGFSLGKALTGGALIGGAGLLGGFAGKNKVMITCLSCGYKWKAGR